jgi:hypothetical protein
MSGRAVVIAHTSFAFDTTGLPGPHPAIVQTGVGSGVIRQGTRLYADDPIVARHPSMFVDAGVVPSPTGPDAPPEPRPSIPGSERRRGRILSDWVSAYDAAILAMRHGHDKLTWPSVATRMSADTGVYIDKDTLRGWAKADGIPHPGVRDRELPPSTRVPHA